MNKFAYPGSKIWNILPQDGMDATCLISTWKNLIVQWQGCAYVDFLSCVINSIIRVNSSCNGWLQLVGIYVCFEIIHPCFDVKQDHVLFFLDVFPKNKPRHTAHNIVSWWSKPKQWHYHLEFSRSNMEFAITQPKMVQLPRNEKQTYRLNSRHQMQSLGLTLATTLTLNFMVNFLNSRISGVGGPIDIEQKGVIHDRDRDLLVTKMRGKDLPDSDQGDFRCRRAVDSSNLHTSLTAH